MLKLFDSFAGYGGAEFALKKAGIEHECIGFSEIDKYAIQIFNQNHKYWVVNNFYTPTWYGDITKINWKEVPDFDLLCGGFPCQDISQAGKQDIEKGRSALVFELTKALREKQPKYFLFENVSAIEQEKFKDFLRKAENEMRAAGYQVFRVCLNSKDYGIPQNRERVWFIGFRKDLAKVFGWNPFPKETGCTLTLKDVLEKEVDKKYFLSKKALEYLARCQAANNEKNRGFGAIFSPEIASTIDTRYGALRNAGETYVDCGKSFCLAGYHKDRVQETPTVSAHFGTGGNNVPLIPLENKVRRLTPRECFRLMGFLNDEINIDGISDSQLYKLAGNGWEINIVSLIFKKMFEGVA